MSTALLTDHYELTMLHAALRSGAADRKVVFEVFTRALPPGRRFGVFAGTGRLLPALADFTFGDAERRILLDNGVIDTDTAAWLAAYRFTGDIDGFAEGEPYLADTPVLTVRGTFGECVLLETLVLSILNHDSAVAAAGARIVAAAGDRPCIEMGGRRTHEEAAVAAARAAYLVGFAATSNLEAGRRWAVPTAGTSSHAFTLVHPTESEAFAAQLAVLGTGTTLLVDTFDVAAGIERAVATAGTALGAVRLDSGDLATTARAVRAQLDRLGATGTRIIGTGDLDERAIARLADAPFDGYGVGTQLVTGSGAPTAGFIYKLVEVDGRPVAKTSVGKATRGGRKVVVRRHRSDGTATADIIYAGQAVRSGAPTPGDGDRGRGGLDGPARTGEHRPTTPADSDSETRTSRAAEEQSLRRLLPSREAGRDRVLLVPLVRGGKLADDSLVGPPGLAQAREHHRAVVAELPAQASDISYGPPCLPVVWVGTPPPRV